MLRNDAEILCPVDTVAQKKGVIICCGWYPMVHVISGSLDRTDDYQLTPDPCERLLSHHVVLW